MTQTRRTEREAAPDPPPGNELVALLWILAVLIAVLELTWWWSAGLSP